MFYSKKFKKFDKINHCFFSRKGGFSKGLYKGLNCGRGSNDNTQDVLKNLEFVSQKMRVKKKNLVLMHQTHSNRVIEINKKNLGKKINSDAVITKLKGIALGVVSADCVPILLYDSLNGIIGCIHAGWKGAYKDIIKNTLRKIKKHNAKSKIFAAIGPCIGKKNYEVDLKFFKMFILKSKKNKKYFSKKNKNKIIFDLRNFVCDKLLKLKVDVDHVNFDTFKEKNNFFSYRRSTILKEKDYGRCISIIRLT